MSFSVEVAMWTVILSSTNGSGYAISPCFVWNGPFGSQMFWGLLQQILQRSLLSSFWELRLLLHPSLFLWLVMESDWHNGLPFLLRIITTIHSYWSLHWCRIAANSRKHTCYFRCWPLCICCCLSSRGNCDANFSCRGRHWSQWKQWWLLQLQPHLDAKATQCDHHGVWSGRRWSYSEHSGLSECSVLFEVVCRQRRCSALCASGEMAHWKLQSHQSSHTLPGARCHYNRQSGLNYNE